ncbi:MAG: hypothetical protein MZV70_01810 [Desulfobacterales bacterium]|nr:hypothetical protein [Desulfobacterales bacterium]
MGWESTGRGATSAGMALRLIAFGCEPPLRRNHWLKLNNHRIPVIALAGRRRIQALRRDALLVRQAVDLTECGIQERWRPPP